MKPRILKLTRVRAHPDAGARTLFFKAEGEDARLRAERAAKGDWRVVPRVNADGAPYAEPKVRHA